jgi:hypothetical protein
MSFKVAPEIPKIVSEVNISANGKSFGIDQDQYPMRITKGRFYLNGRRINYPAPVETVKSMRSTKDGKVYYVVNGDNVYTKEDLDALKSPMMESNNVTVKHVKCEEKEKTEKVEVKSCWCLVDKIMNYLLCCFFR